MNLETMHGKISPGGGFAPSSAASRPGPGAARRSLVLGSSSPYRRRLLDRLGLAFSVAAPAITESPRPGERPAATAARLAEEKARRVAARLPRSLVIGCDQVAELDGAVLGKPLDRERNIEQLALVSGRRVAFHSGLCLVDAASGRSWNEVIPVAVTFRSLSRSEIEAYVDRERAFDCAGGFKAESLGIMLVESIAGEDPTALEGLPLVALGRMLRAVGVDPLVPGSLGAPAPTDDDPA